ncbi:MAG: hypothetical protein ACYS30_25325 [Planctomycetota bacterium]
MTTERSSQWPVSKTPNGNYTETDVTTTTLVRLLTATIPRRT